MISVVAGDGVIRERLPDETLLVFLSDTHIGGSSGSDIFESATELTMLLEDLHRHEGPVELVLAGDFLDVLRMEDADGDPVGATLARPEYRELFATLRLPSGTSWPASTFRSGRGCTPARSSCATATSAASPSISPPG
jgi:hypothetical protein